MVAINMPSVPVAQHKFIEYVAAHPSTPISELLQPFKHYEDELRKVFAQQPEHAVTKQLNIIPVFGGHEKDVKIRARDLAVEPDDIKEKFIMPLRPAERKLNGALAIAESMQHFRTNFNLFTESSLVDLDWNNVVVAGSAVVTSLLSVPEQHAQSKRSLRRYYHEIVAPASDVDLFLYDLTEAQAIEKIKQIEKSVRDALLVESTTIRTKNTITIVSQYPVRHVQIVLRIYKSITEILTGFDVDCSCGAYDGKQVWASPRAIAAYMTQTNTLDLTRRSPSYENRLSKYRHRGFEVRFPELDRPRIDPTIYERSFFRTQGLARLLILEKLPKCSEREAYIDQRRLERGRPAADWSRVKQRSGRGNIKSAWEDEVAEWADADELSGYHTFSIPYGPKYSARKIEKLLYTKDLLLNAEWNKPKDRAVNLHRHPAFFGSVDDVIGDCCGSCPLPLTIEEEEVSEKESKMYMAGKVTFMKDDCGRQAIGSFNPLSPDEYTDMAYVGNTELLCQAIIDRDIHYIEQWLRQDGNNANTRDHTGRCPLHLAVAHSSLEVVQCLIDNGARLIPRMVDGKTALHLACLRGDPSIVSALLRKSESNEEDEMKKSDGRRRLRVAAKNVQAATASTQASTFEVIDTPDSEMDIDAMTEGSMVLVKDSEIEADGRLDQDDNNSPDVYDVNVLTWDTHTSPLHLAILSGHGAVVECLVQDFGANILMPVAPPTPGRHAIGSSKDTRLVLTLAFTLPFNEAKDMTCLLFKLGASSAQADSNQKTALEYCVFDQPDLLETYIISDPVGVARAIKHISMQYSWYASGPLQAAISNRDLDTALRLLRAGARPDVPFEAYIKGVETTANRSQFESHVDQPVVLAIRNEMPLLSGMLIEQYGINPNTLTAEGWRCVHNTGYPNSNGRSLLNLVNDKIKTLREWKHEARKCEPPKTLEEDSIYLSGLSEDTYKYWSAVKQIEDAKRRYKGAWDIHMAHLRTIASDEMGVEEKQAAIYDMLDQFRSLETILHAKSAKKFEELHPDINQVENLYHGGNGCNFGHYTYRTSMDEPFKLAFEFSVAIPNEEVRARYINLFESAWKGDVKTIKQLTMVPWTDINGEKRPPLQIAVQDHQNHSPLSIAVFSGNLDLATTIMAIAAAQYTPPDPPKAQRYHIATNSESEEGPHDIEGDDGASTDIPITSEVVDDNLTIENIGETSLSVKSNVKPEQMLHWEIPETKIAGHANTPTDLTELALARLDTQLLSFLLDQFEQYKDQAEATTAKDASMNKRNRLYQQPDLSWALVFGQPHMLAELIKRTAIGLSLDELALEHGANDTTVKSKYYQGLSVHGKKRKDWAAAGRNTSGLEAHPTQVPPLLVAVYRGTLEQVEWMLSDAPLRCYKHFAQAHQDDRRLQKISASAGGFEIVLKEFLNSRSRLAIHCCLARKEQDKESLDILKYLVEALPEAVEAKSANQCTPLLRAFQSQNLEAARILINAGADQTARDKDGMSLLHQLVACIPLHADDATNMRSMIDLIDKRLLTTLCLQRTSVEPGALTPLALWIERLDGSRKYQSDVTRLLLECSDGSELEAFNGEGLTVLHTLARMDSNPHIHSARPLDLAKIIVERHPALATWESATGKLPVELIEDILFAQRCSAINHAGNYQRRSRNQNAITERSPHEFINRKRVPHDNSIFGHDYNPDSKPELVMELKRHLLISTQAKLDAEGRGRRKLVALHDASEVARRLAGMQRKKLEAEDEKAAGKVDGWPLTFDQVERWLEGSRRAVSVKKWRW